MTRRAIGVGSCLALLCAACGSTPGSGTDAGRMADAAPVDATIALDARPALDATPPGSDATPPGPDATTPGPDATTPDLDAGAIPDAAPTGDAPPPTADAGMCMDLPPEPTRREPTVCSACRPPSIGSGGVGACASDEDCTDGTNGRCVFGRGGTFCDYDLCFQDSDCAPEELCLCDGARGGGNTCVPSNCRTDSDCGGPSCAPTLGSCGHYLGVIGYRCHTPDDTCATDADCGPGYCAFDELAGRWACSTSECAG